MYNKKGDNMKMLVSDYDNTFYTSNIDLNIKAVNEFMKNENIFVIATGRNYFEIKEHIDLYNIKFNYLICNDGGIIYDNNYEVLYRKDINEELAKKIVKLIEKKLNYVELKIDYGNKNLNSNENKINGIICKIKNKKQGEQFLKKIESLYPEIHGYIVMPFLNITEYSVNKANGVKRLQKKLKILNKNIYTIGDDVNDISMIEEYRGYLMENAKITNLFEKKLICSSVAELVDKINNN